MKTSTLATFMLSIALGATSAASRAEAPVKVAGGVLTTAAGMTLYTYDSDQGGKSSCNGPCASNWPPLIAPDNEVGDGAYGVIMRDDGKKQWTYKGKPLYQFVKDKTPGDKVGDGLKNVWHAAMP